MQTERSGEVPQSSSWTNLNAKCRARPPGEPPLLHMMVCVLEGVACLCALLVGLGRHVGRYRAGARP